MTTSTSLLLMPKKYLGCLAAVVLAALALYYAQTFFVFDLEGSSLLSADAFQPNNINLSHINSTATTPVSISPSVSPSVSPAEFPNESRSTNDVHAAPSPTSLNISTTSISASWTQNKSIPFSKYFIISLNIGSPLGRSTELVIENHMNYSDMYNYRYQVFSMADIMNMAELHDTNLLSTWCHQYKTCYKVLIFHHIFTDAMYKDSFQYVLFMDADAYFVNFAISLDAVLQRANYEHCQYGFINTTQSWRNQFVWSQQGELINAGVMLWENTAFIYQHMIQLMYDVMSDACKKRIYLRFHEQSILTMILKGLTYDIWQNHLVPDTISDDVDPENATYWHWIRRYCFYQHDDNVTMKVTGTMDGKTIIKHCVHPKFHPFVTVLPRWFMNCGAADRKSCTFIQHRSGGNKGKKMSYIQQTTHAVHQESGLDAGDRKQLFFVHIPKTGGTVIEDIAKQQAHLFWGRFSWNTRSSQYQNLSHYLCHRQEKQCCSRYLWHCPPSYIMEYQRSAVHSNKFEVYNLDKQNLFAVVRNPYTRLLSVYWELHGSKQQFARFCDTEAFNTWIRTNMQNITAHPTNCVSFDNHLMPQWRYFYDDDFNQAVIAHTIHFEALHDEFNHLMESYHVDVQIYSFTKHTNEHHSPFCDKVQVGTLNPMELNLVQTVYKNDFVFFGYDMYDTNITYG